MGSTMKAAVLGSLIAASREGRSSYGTISKPIWDRINGG